MSAPVFEVVALKDNPGRYFHAWHLILASLKSGRLCLGKILTGYVHTILQRELDPDAVLVLVKKRGGITAFAACTRLIWVESRRAAQLDSSLHIDLLCKGHKTTHAEIEKLIHQIKLLAKTRGENQITLQAINESALLQNYGKLGFLISKGAAPDQGLVWMEMSL